MQAQALDYIVLVVGDLDRALAFYCDTMGLPLKHRAARFAQLQTGTTRLGLFTREAMAETLGQEIRPPAADAPAFEIGFKFDDVDEAWRTLTAAGAEGVTAPHDRPWGQRTAYIRDPDGNLVELVEQLEKPRPA